MITDLLIKGAVAGIGVHVVASAGRALAKGGDASFLDKLIHEVTFKANNADLMAPVAEVVDAPAA